MSLHDKAILVSLSTPKYGLNRHDDTEAKAAAQCHGADSKSIGGACGRWSGFEGGSRFCSRRLHLVGSWLDGPAPAM